MAVIFHSIPTHSPEWHSFRLKSGLGASEVGICMGLSEWECKLSLWERKIGIRKSKPKNLRMHMGLKAEPIIADLFSHYDKDENKFLSNIESGRKVYELEEVNAIAQNSEIPYLFASLDRRYKDKDGNYVAVELKHKSSQAYKQYEGQINPCELIQLACQLLCTEYKLGRICYLIDNTRLEVFDLTYKDALKLKPSIMKEVSLFWQSVEKAKILQNKIFHAKSEYNNRLASELEIELHKLEPSPENSQAYYLYMTELAREKKETIGIKGDEIMLEKGKKLKKIADQKKRLEKQEVELKSELMTVMRKEDRWLLDFGKSGHISAFNGRFTNKIKP